MKYLKIQNKGLLPREAFTLMGASTKSGDSSTFGEFGTGLKYAIAHFGRENIPLIVFLGERRLRFGIKEIKIKNKSFDCITINDKKTNLTTKYGEKWEAWMAIREVWCNASDEKGASHNVVEEVDSVHPLDCTTFYIGVTESILEVIEKWEEHFLIRTDALYESDKIVIYPSNGDPLRIYKSGILILERNDDCLFHYDIKNAEINELREYKGLLGSDIAGHLLNTNEEVVTRLRDRCNKDLREGKNKSFETGLDFYMWHWMCNVEYKESIKRLFSGKLYISSLSSNDSKYGIMMPDSLLSLLKTCGLKTLTVHYNSGYGYSGSSYSDYEIISHPRLEDRIKKRINMLDIELSFDTMTPVNGSDSDFVYKDSAIIFNTRLEYVDDRELTAIILSAYLLKKDKNYVTLRRLIKGMLGNTNRLKQMLQL